MIPSGLTIGHTDTNRGLSALPNKCLRM